MAADAAALSSALMAIYDAGIAENRWSSALDATLEATGTAAAVMYRADDFSEAAFRLAEASSNVARLEAETGFLTRYDALVNSGRGSGLDAEGAARLHREAPFVPVMDQEFWPLEDFGARPEVRFVRDRLGTFRRFFLNLSQDPAVPAALLLHYPKAVAAIPPADMETAALLAPHLAQAVDLHRMAFALRAKYRAVLSVLDRFGLGICLIGERGEAVLSNARARGLFAEGGALWLDRGGRPVCRDPDATARLRALLGAAARTAAGQDRGRGGEMVLDNPAGGGPLLALAAPLRDAGMEFEPGFAGALLTLVDPRQAAEIRLAPFAEGYGLTAAETEVAGLLLKGRSAREIAEIRGSAIETVRTHLKSVYSKTGTHSRTGLLWRAFQFAPPVL